MSTKWIWLTLCGAMVGALHSAPSGAAEPPGAQRAPAEREAALLEAALLEADQRFVAGDLHGALDILEPACDGSARPECAFSLAAIHHGLGHCREARTNYRRYRDIAPTGGHIEEVREALEEVETRCGNAGGSTATGAAVPGVAPSSSALPGISLAAPTALPALDSAVAAEPRSTAPPPPSAPGSIGTELVLGSFALSGAAAITSVVFGILAARSAGRCARAQVYDREFSDECEDKGPRYQGLWQGFALASGGFLGVGLTLWWLDSDSATFAGVSGGSVRALQYQGRF